MKPFNKEELSKKKGRSNMLLYSQWLLDKAKSGFVLTILTLLLFCQSYALASTPCDSMLQKKMVQTWKEFREIHPSCFQTIALKHYGGDTCVFVMSEPPGWVSQDSIKTLFNSYGGHMGIGQHTWGYDGVLTDAIGCAKLNKTSFTSFERELFSLFYGSAYKPYYTNLDNPVPHANRLPDIQNYEEGTDSLEYIVHLPFFSALTLRKEILPINIVTLQEIRFLPSDVYYSNTPGYVVWLLDPSDDFRNGSEYRKNARKFLLDTDLIIAAIPSQRRLAIIGRERQTPVEVLPPLRAETILLLAKHAEADTFHVNIPADSTTYIEDSLYYTTIEMSEPLRHSELGILMMMAAEASMNSASQQVLDYFATPRNLDLVRCKQYALLFKAFKEQSQFTHKSLDMPPYDTHVWMEAPTAIVTNAPLENTSFVMQ